MDIQMFNAAESEEELPACWLFCMASCNYYCHTPCEVGQANNVMTLGNANATQSYKANNW